MKLRSSPNVYGTVVHFKVPGTQHTGRTVGAGTVVVSHLPEELHGVRRWERRGERREEGRGKREERSELMKYGCKRGEERSHLEGFVCVCACVCVGVLVCVHLSIVVVFNNKLCVV